MTDTLMKLFEDAVQDMHNAEKQSLRGMKELVDVAECQHLKKALEFHIIQTEGHLERLADVAEMLEMIPCGKAFNAADGLAEEWNALLSQVPPGPILDAAIVQSVQKTEHHEICTYGTLIAWAHQLGMIAAASVMEQTLAEEKRMDLDLTHIAAAFVNRQALSFVQPQSMATLI